MSKQEIVDDGSLFITRIAVPGGWVYNSYDKSHAILGSCFAPKHEIHDEMLSLLREIYSELASMENERTKPILDKIEALIKEVEGKS